MKILLIGIPVTTTSSIRSFSDMWIYYLHDSLQRAGVEIIYYRRFNGCEKADDYVSNVLVAAEGCQAILAPGVRYFTSIPMEIGQRLRREFSGWVAHIYDGSLLDCPVVDVTFTIKDDTWRFEGNLSKLERHLKYNVNIGWAADQDLFYPEPNNSDELRIFFDHCVFDTGGVDRSLTAMMNLKYLRVPFCARTLTDDGIVTINPDEIIVRPYKRTPVPAPELAAELRKTDVFVVTHPESLGQTVIEAAKCGALILSFDGALPPDRLQLVNHILYTSVIDWDDVISKVNRFANAEKVSGYTWDNVAAVILNTFRKKKIV